MGDDRWIGVGHSNVPGGRAAGEEAALAALAGSDPKLFVVFASDDYRTEELLAGVLNKTPDVPLIGCSTAGEITRSGPADSSVVVFALGGEGFNVATGAAPCVDGLRAAAAAVAESAVAIESSPNRVLLLLTDGLAGDQQEVVRGAYSVVGAEMPLVGGCAGDNLKMKHTQQFHGANALSNSVVGASIGSTAPLGIGVCHGWQRVGEPMVVTMSDENSVMRLNDEPALDVYLAGLSASTEVANDPEAFTRFALTHPLGLQRRSGEEVRFITGADFATRSLLFVAHVPQGGLTWFMQGDEDSVLSATDAACEGAIGQLGGLPPLGVLAFDCIARRGVLGESGITSEVERIAAKSGDAPVAGFYTYGEIARIVGNRGFHNQTLVVLALA